MQGFKQQVMMVERCASIVGSTENVQTNGTTNNSFFPLNGLYDYSRCAQIYLASELGTGAKQLTRIEIEGATGGGYTYLNQDIWIGHCQESAFPNSLCQIDLSDITVTDLTKVVDQQSFYSNPPGWWGLDFDTNFCWNGRDNIVIRWDNLDGAYNSGYPSWETLPPSATTTSRAWMVEQDNTIPNTTASRESIRVNLRFDY